MNDMMIEAQVHYLIEERTAGSRKPHLADVRRRRRVHPRQWLSRR
ncbi:MAG TPA: hypothetical protein VFI30_02805 [Nocardioidaceae bacterium]|nr:hypothetical protein [Nocardioidaceae bacterium]